MDYTGHMSKRQRTTTDGHGVGKGSQDKFEDPHKPPMSKVVHVRQITEYATENNLHEAVRNFGPIRNIMMMKSRGQALVEFEDISSAKNCVNCAQLNKIYVCGQPAFFNYSTSQEIRPVNPMMDGSPPNKILLFTIINPHYPITVDVMHTICQSSGNVQRIVIFKKNGIQAMVEFETIDEAVGCKEALNGADIYSGCCTLKIDFAKTFRLNVVKNDSESWDFTNPNMGKGSGSANRSLLPDPQYGSGGYGGSNFGGGGQRGMNQVFNGPGPSPFGDGNYDSSFGGGYNKQSDYYSGPGPRFQEGMGGGMMPPAQGGVMMVYNLNTEKVNCDILFNILCLYGNVIRIKFLRSKEGTAMVQMGDYMSVDRCKSLFHDCPFFGNNLQIGSSKQAFLQEVQNPHELPDGTPSYKDYSKSKNNRYSTPAAASKNRCIEPSKYLHYFNAPLNVTEEELMKLFSDHDLNLPTLTQFPKKSEKSSSGLFEFSDLAESIDALAIVNHQKLASTDDRYPYVIRMCFSMPPKNPIQ